MATDTGFARNQGASPSGRFEAQHRQIERKSRRAYVKAGIFLFLALVAGMVIGAGITLLVIKSRMHTQMPKAEQIGRSVLDRLDESVRLTPEEKIRLEQIILARMVEVDKVRMESLSAISREFDEMNDQVDEVLGPERSDKWEADKQKRYGKFYRGKTERHHESSRRVGRPGPPPQAGDGHGMGMGPRHR